MSVAQEPYIPSPAHTNGPPPPAMALNTMLDHARQPYESYSQVPEQRQQQGGQPQIQLPLQTVGEPAIVSTVHEGRIYRYWTPERRAGAHLVKMNADGDAAWISYSSL